MVTIVIGCNVDRGYLDRCIKSVQDQSYKDIELILIKLPDSIAVNFNKGLWQAKGEFIKEVSEDDWLPEMAIQDLVDGIGDHPWVVANAWNYEDGHARVEERPDVEKLNLADMCVKNVIHGGTVLYRTEIIREIGGMDESLWTAEEYDMHLRLMKLGYMPGYVDKFVYNYRLWSGQKSRRLRMENKIARENEIKRIQSLYSDTVQ